MKDIIFLIGPTASGKTGIAIALAKKLHAEIISADSMQVYQGMDIMSQKPTAYQQSRIPHHMIGTVSPAREYSVAAYKTATEKIIKKIGERGKAPLIVGGSGLYIRALIDGLFPSGPGQNALRKRLYALSRRYGNRYLHNRLKKRDPRAAAAIHPHNVRRIIRALEVCATTGSTFSRMKRKTKGLPSRYTIAMVGLRRQRSDLYERINKRVDRMLEQGLVNEVKACQRRKLSRTAKAALGYKEMRGYLGGTYTREQAIALLKRNTRRFAKRQITWFRKDSRITWVDIGKNDTKKTIIDNVLHHISL
jgi:tRNA dimethylallyltransferase